MTCAACCATEIRKGKTMFLTNIHDYKDDNDNWIIIKTIKTNGK